MNALELLRPHGVSGNVCRMIGRDVHACRSRNFYHKILLFVAVLKFDGHFPHECDRIAAAFYFFGYEFRGDRLGLHRDHFQKQGQVQSRDNMHVRSVLQLQHDLLVDASP